MNVWRSFVPFLTVFAVSTCLAQQGSQPVVHVTDGGQSDVMESIFVPPKSGAPVSFTLYSEWTRHLGGGGTFTVTNKRRIIRDSQGRIYQERATLVPKGNDVAPFVTTIQITDPRQHTWYNCIVLAKVCEIYKYTLSTTDKFVPARNGNLTSSNGSTSDEDLGVSSTMGEDTHGYRETRTTNPGVIGNDQPMVNVREFWYSPRLAINLISMVDDSLSGRQAFTARDLSTAEPDPAIFEIPAGYSIADHRPDEK
jgi:hypothetical protein